MEDMWAMKVELPDFTGTDPVGWIARAERFFEDQEIPSSDKLQWAFMSMEGEAMLWFHSWCQEFPDLDSDWGSFSMAMIKRFGERDGDRGVAGLIIEDEEVLAEMKKDEENTNGNVFEGRAIGIQIQTTVWPKKTQEQHEIGDTILGIARKEGVEVSDVCVSHNLHNPCVVVGEIGITLSPVAPAPPPKPPDIYPLKAALPRPNTPAEGPLVTSLRPLLRKMVNKSPWGQASEDPILLKEEERLQMIQEVRCLDMSPPPEPPDTDPHATATGFILVKQSCPHISLYHGPVAAVGKVLEKVGAEWVFFELGLSLDFMGQAQSVTSFDGIPRGIVMGATTASYVPCIDSTEFLTFVLAIVIDSSQGKYSSRYDIQKSSKIIPLVKNIIVSPEVDNFVPLVLAAKTVHVHQNVVLLSEPVIMVNAQDATVDILEDSSRLVLFLVRAVMGDAVIPLNLKENDSRLSPTGFGILTSRMVQLLEAGLASYRKWDLEKRDLFFDDYCTRRIFGGSVIAVASVLMLMSGFSGDLGVLPTTITHQSREVIATIRMVAALNLEKRMHGLLTTNFEDSLLSVYGKDKFLEMDMAWFWLHSIFPMYLVFGMLFGM